MKTIPERFQPDVKFFLAYLYRQQEASDAYDKLQDIDFSNGEGTAAQRKAYNTVLDKNEMLSAHLCEYFVESTLALAILDVQAWIFRSKGYAGKRKSRKRKFPRIAPPIDAYPAQFPSEIEAVLMYLKGTENLQKGLEKELSGVSQKKLFTTLKYMLTLVEHLEERLSDTKSTAGLLKQQISVVRGMAKNLKPKTPKVAK